MVFSAAPASSLNCRSHEPRERSDACANVLGWKQVSEEETAVGVSSRELRYCMKSYERRVEFFSLAERPVTNVSSFDGSNSA